MESRPCIRVHRAAHSRNDGVEFWGWLVHRRDVSCSVDGGCLRLVVATPLASESIRLLDCSGDFRLLDVPSDRRFRTTVLATPCRGIFASAVGTLSTQKQESGTHVRIRTYPTSVAINWESTKSSYAVGSSILRKTTPASTCWKPADLITATLAASDSFA